jgi:hypothetical protein
MAGRVVHMQRVVLRGHFWGCLHVLVHGAGSRVCMQTRARERARAQLPGTLPAALRCGAQRRAVCPVPANYMYTRARAGRRGDR